MSAAFTDLLDSAKEAERVLKFAFEDGALPDHTVRGLTIDPYGMLADLRVAIANAEAALSGKDRP